MCCLKMIKNILIYALHGAKHIPAFSSLDVEDLEARLIDFMDPM